VVTDRVVWLTYHSSIKVAHRRAAFWFDQDGSLMPRLSAFYGIAIYMYWNERDHPVPHFHA
jgi:hypothetical protein